jgi:hypothetical protein
MCPSVRQDAERDVFSEKSAEKETRVGQAECNEHEQIQRRGVV